MTTITATASGGAMAVGRRTALPAYLLALAVGVLGVFTLMPVPAILGTGALWTSPTGDLAQNLTGHLAFQEPGWSWPVLLAPALFWPHGLSIGMTDSNPLVSLIAKLLAALRGEPANLLGFWFAACWLLQPIAAVYALRGMTSRALSSALPPPCWPRSFRRCCTASSTSTCAVISCC